MIQEQVARVFELQSRLTGNSRYEDEKILISGEISPSLVDFTIHIKLNGLTKVYEMIDKILWEFKPGLWQKYLDVVIKELSLKLADKYQIPEYSYPGIDDSSLFPEL